MPKTGFRCLFLLIFLWVLSGGVMAQGNVRVVVSNDAANVRLSPSFGGEIIATVNSGYVFDSINARSGDNEWLRIDYFGHEAWIHIAPMVVLQGDIFALPVRDPRSIPAGGFEAPRSGPTSVQPSSFAVTIDGLRLRAGPSTAYPMLANIPYNSIVGVTGRSESGIWYQVVYDNILGWVSGQYLEFEGPINVQALPLGGIVADAPPTFEDTSDNYIGTLKHMRDRVDIAQFSLDAIRAAWTDAALYGRGQCSSYPPRPSDMHIATPLLAANYPTLNPLLNDFNDAMANTRLAIDLMIEVCNLPGTANPVGSATVQGALDVVNLADTQFASLRSRLNELIPDVLAPGPNECLFIFRNKAELVPRINLNTVYLDSMDARNTANGYCFDLVAGQIVAVQSLQLGEANNVLHFMSFSPFDNPTNFLAVGRGGLGGALIVSPIRITETGRFILIFVDDGTEERSDEEGRSEVPLGDYAFAVSDITNSLVVPQLIFNEETGVVSLEGGGGSVTEGGGEGSEGGGVEEPPPGETGVTCPSTNFTCNQLFTCDEAYACLNAGAFQLDPDEDGVPCEETLCNPP